MAISVPIHPHSITLELCYISKLYSQVFTHSSGTCMRETHHEEMCEISLHEGHT